MSSCICMCACELWFKVLKFRHIIIWIKIWCILLQYWDVVLLKIFINCNYLHWHLIILHWNRIDMLKSFHNPLSFSMLICVFGFYVEFRSPYTVSISMDKHEQDISTYWWFNCRETLGIREHSRIILQITGNCGVLWRLKGMDISKSSNTTVLVSWFTQLLFYLLSNVHGDRRHVSGEPVVNLQRGGSQFHGAW